MRIGRRKQKMIKFQEILSCWFQNDGRKFPWRRGKKTAYQIIISEILLQRTNANSVAKFYPDFIKKYPSWRKLSFASKEELEHVLKPLGLNVQRAVRLYKLSQEMGRRNGRLPKSRMEFEQLPMIGQYIANAYDLFVKNKNAPLLDVNMSRVLERYFGPRKLADIRDDPYLQELAHEVVNMNNSKEINWAILDYAQLVCRARNPGCDICNLSSSCHYYGGQ